jgi:hypothetical protein
LKEVPKGIFQKTLLAYIILAAQGAGALGLTGFLALALPLTLALANAGLLHATAFVLTGRHLLSLLIFRLISCLISHDYLLLALLTWRHLTNGLWGSMVPSVFKPGS